MSQRRNIVNFLVDNLKLIDGTSSPLGSYRFKSALHGNVYRGYKFIDEINDFPSIYVVAGSETRNYQTTGTTQSQLVISLRGYVYDEEYELINENYGNITSDLEHVIYNLPRTHSDYQILDVIIQSINTDEGLLTPYGIVELQILISYEVYL
jgi:hypothetical protein|tara:strand:- start:44 stop:499 length:456 start_codon:yes stop_codon:yes gene_type:complete